MIGALRSCHECGKAVSNSEPTCPHCGAKAQLKSRRGCLIGGALAVAVLFALGGRDRQAGPLTPEQRRAATHYTGERYTAPTSSLVCETLPELRRMMELLADPTDDHIAAVKFLAVSSCQMLRQPAQVIVEDHEGFDFVRVRETGGIVSWYMLDNELE